MEPQPTPTAEATVDTHRSTAALILCGGRSSRMQQDKNFITWRGRSLLLHVVHQVQTVCSRVILVKSARDQPLPPDLRLDSLEVVVDTSPLAGPAAALAAGLDHLNASSLCLNRLPTEHDSKPSETLVFLSGSDSPCLRPAWVHCLLDRLRQSTHALAVVPRLAEDPAAVFPLCAAYSSRSQPLVADYVQRGGRSMRGLLKCLPVQWLEETQMRQIDPDLRSLINLNTPADLSALDRLT